jgi:hypothetical protein
MLNRFFVALVIAGLGLSANTQDATYNTDSTEVAFVDKKVLEDSARAKRKACNEENTKTDLNVDENGVGLTDEMIVYSPDGVLVTRQSRIFEVYQGLAKI